MFKDRVLKIGNMSCRHIQWIKASICARTWVITIWWRVRTSVIHKDQLPKWARNNSIVYKNKSILTILQHLFQQLIMFKQVHQRKMSKDHQLTPTTDLKWVFSPKTPRAITNCKCLLIIKVKPFTPKEIQLISFNHRCNTIMNFYLLYCQCCKELFFIRNLVLELVWKVMQRHLIHWKLIRFHLSNVGTVLGSSNLTQVLNL